MKTKLSLAKRIESYLRRHPVWINGGEIERLALNAGYKSSNASRRCREMVSGIDSSGKSIPIVLEKKEEKGTVWYRYKPQEKIISTPVFTSNNTVIIKQEKMFI